MVVKLYVSGNSGNKEIMSHQQRIVMILRSLNIEFEMVDITAPGLEYARDFMRANGKKKENQRNVLPPQIFNEQHYCGDYDDFDVANEDDELEEFLGIERITPKSTPIFKKGQQTNDADKQSGVSESATEEPKVPANPDEGAMEQSDEVTGTENGVKDETAEDVMNNEEPSMHEVNNEVTEDSKEADNSDKAKATQKVDTSREEEVTDSNPQERIDSNAAKEEGGEDEDEYEYEDEEEEE